MRRGYGHINSDHSLEDDASPFFLRYVVATPGSSRAKNTTYNDILWP